MVSIFSPRRYSTSFSLSFTTGQSNPTFMVTSGDGVTYTVRKQPPGKLLPGAHAVDREYQVMTALRKLLIIFAG